MQVQRWGWAFVPHRSMRSIHYNILWFLIFSTKSPENAIESELLEVISEGKYLVII